MKVTDQLISTYEKINDCTYNLGYKRDRLPRRLTVMTCKNLLCAFKPDIPKKKYKELELYIDNNFNNSVSLDEYLKFEETVINSGTFSFKYKDLKKYRKYNSMDYYFSLERLYKKVGLMSVFLFVFSIILTNLFNIFFSWETSLLIGMFMGTILSLLLVLHLNDIKNN